MSNRRKTDPGRWERTRRAADGSVIWPAEPLSADVYGAGFPGRGPADIPAQFWRKIELAYPDGTVRTIVYEREPADDRELPELMLRVQLAAEQYGFRVTVIGADGSRTYAPAMVP